MKTAIVAAFFLGFGGGVLVVVSLMYAHGSMAAEAEGGAR